MATKAKTTTKKSDKAATTSVIAAICKELKIDPRIARRKLRGAGMKAPYTDATAVRKALTATVKS
jgi:hypothetical protein